MSAGQTGKHWASRPRGWTRYRVPALVTAGVLVLGVVGAGAGYLASRPTAAEKRAHAAEVARSRAAAEARAVRSNQDALLAGLRITPGPGVTGVALDSAVTVSAATGTVTAVKVVSSAGAALVGTMHPSGQWVATAGLQPATTYTVTVDLTGLGVTAVKTTTFTTLTPSVVVTATAYPTTGMTVGVGQPIVLRFDHAVTGAAEQKAIESRLTVAMSSPVPGGWYWFSDHELHFRPHGFWPPHETIRVTGDLDGIDLGAGRWTSGTVLETFSIGDARISYANLDSEVMTVTLDGRTLYTYPISGGRPKYPTMDGTHIVLDRESVVHMVSSTVGIPVKSPDGYDEYVYDDVHISDSGEYVHAAPWSVGSQGVSNVSHGCINLSPTHAQQYFDFSRVGDVVEVTGSSRPPAWGDHGVMDWSGPSWSEWAPATVVALPGTAPTTTVAPTTVAPTTTAPPAAPASTAAPATTAVPVRTTPATTAPHPAAKPATATTATTAR